MCPYRPCGRFEPLPSCRFHDFKAFHPSGVRRFRRNPFPSCPWPLQGFALGLHRFAVTGTCRSCPFAVSSLNWPGLQRFLPQSACVCCKQQTFTLLGVRPPGISPGTELFDASTESPAPFGRLAGFALSSGRHLHNPEQINLFWTRSSNKLKTWHRILRSDTVAAPPGLLSGGYTRNLLLRFFASTEVRNIHSIRFGYGCQGEFKIFL